MLGAYLAWQIDAVARRGHGQLLARGAWRGARASRCSAASIERLLLRHLYGREELYQLLFTYALVLILGDAAKRRCGARSSSRVPRPAGPRRRLRALRHRRAALQSVHHRCSGRRIAVALLAAAQPHRHRPHDPRRGLDREMLGALGADVGRLYTLMFMAGSFLAGLGGALVTPVRSIVPGMDVEIIVEAFIVVVIGGLGSFWGTFLGALDLRPGAVLRHPDLAGLLDLRGVRPDGAGADRAPLGPARPAGEAMTPMRLLRRIPWAVLVFLAARLRAVARLALLHVPRDRHRDPRAVRRRA